ncbi:MAG: TetR/AcrR family transcriptional regulator, partial [Anaerolineae bacterium]
RTRQAILDATRRLLVEKGINGVSLRAIAREIDYSPAGLYEYFDGKDDIIEAVCKEGHQRLADEMGQADEDLPYPIYLLGIGQGYLRFARSNPDYFMLMFTTAPFGSQLEEFEKDSSSFPTLIYAIQKGIDEGYFDMHPGGIYTMAMIFWSSVHGLAMLEQTQLKGANLDFEQMSLAVLNNVFQGLTKK